MQNDNKKVANIGKIVTSIKKFVTSLQYKLRAEPGSKLNLVAVTGTAGKTTTARILYEIFNAVGVNIAAITSQGTFLRDQQISNVAVDQLTSSELYDILTLLQKSNASLVILETPIPLIEKYALEPLTFQATILTNLILEHPDEDPLAEKIFSPILRTKEKGLVILNGDDENISWVNSRSEAVEQKLFAAWCKQDQVQNLVFSRHGCAFSVNGQSFSIPLLSGLNVSNVLLALRFALQYLKPAQIASILSRIEPLPGKIEPIIDDPFTVVIDEATNPLVYSKVASSLRELQPNQAKLITVVGANSTADDIVGFVAALNSKVIILAPQNSGTNDLAMINSAIITAAEQKSGVLVERFSSPEEFSLLDQGKLISKMQRVIENGDVPIISFDEPSLRAMAIQFALGMASNDDCVLISGMGARSEMFAGGVYYQWSDADVVNQTQLA